MKRVITVAIASTMIAVAACSAERDQEYQTAVDTLTRRQKDSLISTMPVPAARSVGRAMDAADRAAERAGALDSIR